MRARKKHDDLLADSFARAKEEQARLDALGLQVRFGDEWGVSI